MHGHSSILGLLAFILFITGSLFGCDVREDRGTCPCHITLDLSRAGEVSGQEALIRDGVVITMKSLDGLTSFCDSVPGSDSIRNIVLDGVQEVTYVLSAISGNCLSPNPFLGVKATGERPVAWMWADTFSVSEEDVTVPVVLHKNYATVCLDLVPGSLTGNVAVSLRDSVAGLLPSLEPVAGLRIVDLKPVYSGPSGTSSYVVRYEFNVLRHSDFPLWLDITDSRGATRSFAIGEYIRASGYDWNAEDLDDLALKVDLAFTSLTLSTQRWPRPYTSKIEI